MTTPSTLWNYEYIQRLTNEATIRANAQGLEPAPADRLIASYRNSNRFNIPFLGDHIPEGWYRTSDEPVFVGVGGNAISRDVFFKRVESIMKRSKEVLGYGVIERGQTQALVATYRRTT